MAHLAHHRQSRLKYFFVNFNFSMIHGGSSPQGVRVNKGQGREGGGMSRGIISLRSLVPKKVGKVTVSLQNAVTYIGAAANYM